MLSFLAPWTLLGLALLAVPTVIHLFKPRRVRVVLFSSLRWLRASQQRLSKRIQWHQILLYLMRAAMLALLVLAAARPVMARRGGARDTQRFVVIDTGRAMGYESGHGPGAMARARRLAAEILAGAGAGDLSSVLAAGDAVRALGPLTPDASAFIEPLSTLKAGSGETPVSEALRLIPLLQRGKPAPGAIELFFLTANLDASWRQTEIRDFIDEARCPVRVTVMPVTDPDWQNAWIADSELLQSPVPGSQILRVQVQANDSRAGRREISLTGVRGTSDMRQEVVMEAGRPSWVTFEIPGSDDGRDARTGRLSLTPHDALPDDDQYWVDLAPRGRQEVLLIEDEATQIRELQAAFHLRTAFETLAEASPGRFQITRRTPEALQENDLAQADWIFWVEPRPISAGALEALEAGVAAGAGLALFMGPATDHEYCNNVLFAPPPEKSLLPRRMEGNVTAGAGQPRVRLANIQWSHPLLAPFADPVYGGLARVQFNTYVRLAEPPEKSREQVLATFPDLTPALIDSAYGAGRVLFVNSTANDAWGEFPRHSGYLPWIDGMLAHLNSSGSGRRLNVGDAAYLVPGDLQPERPVVLLDPQGGRVSAAIERQAGRHVVQSAPLTQPGLYRLQYTDTQGGEAEMPVIVQVGRAQSRLAPAEPEILEEWWAPAAFSLKVPDTSAAGSGADTLRNNLELLLLLLAVTLFFCETIWASKLCPRVNPKIESQSVVAKRGFFREHAEAAPVGAASAEGGAE